MRSESQLFLISPKKDLTKPLFNLNNQRRISNKQCLKYCLNCVYMFFTLQCCFSVHNTNSFQIFCHSFRLSFSQPSLKCEVCERLEEQKLKNDFAHAPEIGVTFHHKIASYHLRLAIVTVDVLRWTINVGSSAFIHRHHDRFQCIFYHAQFGNEQHIGRHML